MEKGKPVLSLPKPPASGRGLGGRWDSTADSSAAYHLKQDFSRQLDEKYDFLLKEMKCMHDDLFSRIQQELQSLQHTKKQGQDNGALSYTSKAYMQHESVAGGTYIQVPVIEHEAANHVIASSTMQAVDFRREFHVESKPKEVPGLKNINKEDGADLVAFQEFTVLEEGASAFTKFGKKDSTSTKDSTGTADDDSRLKQFLEKRRLSRRMSVDSISGGTPISNQESPCGETRLHRKQSDDGSKALGSTSSANPEKGESKVSPLAKYIWVFMEEPGSSKAAYAYACISPILILFTVAAAFLSTVEDLLLSSIDFLSVLDQLVDCFFTMEFLLRLGVCPSKTGFVRDWYNLIDFACILPLPFKVLTSFRLPGDTLSTGNTMLHAAVICIVPTLRLLKTTKHYWGFRILVKSLKTAFEALPVPSFLLVVIMVTFSSILFLIEPRSNLASMSDALWFVIVTVSTVGYGDISPETEAGRFISGILIVVGCLYTAMPIQIVGEAFCSVWKDRDRILLVEKTRDKLIQWGYSTEDVEVFFEHYDEDRNGSLDIEEFKNMMNDIQPGIPESRVVKLFQVLDDDGGGEISAEEFLNLVFPEWLVLAVASPSKES